MSITIESLDARVKDLESRVAKLEGKPDPQPAGKTILAFKADPGSEFLLVEKIGAKWVTTSRWPGGGLPPDAVEAGASGKLNIIPRYQRERSVDKPPLLPLNTQAEVDDAVAVAEKDADDFVAAKVKWVAIGNEPDAYYTHPTTKVRTRDRFWRGTLYEFGAKYGVHIAGVFRRRGMGIIWELPQVDYNNVPEFVRGLIESGAYRPGDKFSFHSYQSNAEGHISRLQLAISRTRETVKKYLGIDLPISDFCEIEWSIAMGGPDDGKLVREKENYEECMKLGLWLLAKYRIQRNKHPESYLSPFDTSGNPTFTHEFWNSVPK